MVLWRVLLLVGLWLLFESAISWLATCDQPSYYATTYDGQKDHCTLFSGPLVSLVRFGVTSLLDFLHTYEKQLVAGFTVVLAIFTGTLWWSTNKLWRAGERQMELIERNAAQQASDMKASIAAAEQATNATAKSADAMVGVERAWLHLVVEGENFGRAVGDVLEPPSGSSMVIFLPAGPPTVKFCFKNYGKTPAFMKEVSANLVHLTQLPEMLAYQPQVPPPRQNAVGAGESTDVLEASYPSGLPAALGALLTTEEAKSIKAGNSALWFYGHAIYDDVWGNEHVTRFCWRYDGFLGWFTPSGGKPNNERT